MRHRHTPGLLLTVAVAVLAAPAPGVALELEEVIAKHVEARGGDAWQKIESVKMTGTFTAFSVLSDFTLLRKRDDRYHIDHEMNGHRMIVGNDGREPWSDNGMMQSGAQPLSGADLAAQTREFDFVTPFFDIQRLGHTAELVGETEYEGEPAIGIDLTRKDGSKESWFLDPETYLELARTCPGSDFGRPMEQRTVFDDFREVAGVQIPHLIETQWYTRDRVMAVDEIEINPTLDDAVFRMPAPEGMDPLQLLVGEWDVDTESRQQPGAEFEKKTRKSTVAKHLRGGLLQETYSAENTDVIRFLSYDKFRKTYRIAEIDGRSTFLDIQEGTFDDEGKLVVDNLKTKTTLDMMGMQMFFRTSLSGITDEGFTVAQEVSMDGGESFWLATTSVYKRAAPEQTAQKQ